jgi:hypothetical protein
MVKEKDPKSIGGMDAKRKYPVMISISHGIPEIQNHAWKEQSQQEAII